MPEMPFVDFYARLVVGNHGDSVENGPGLRPRGFYSEGKPGSIRLMAVLLNPGQPRAGEAELQGDATGARLAQIVWDFTGLVLKGDHYSRTLSVLSQDLAQLLDRPFPQCLDIVLMTNLVRCTTKGNLSPDDKAVKIGAGWLREEIALWQPEKVVAFGNDTAIGMLSHGIRVDALLPHPAYRKGGDHRRECVAEVRTHIGLS